MTPLTLFASPPKPPTVPSDEALYAFVQEILPYRRSITGEGLRQTLAAISARKSSPSIQQSVGSAW